MPKKIAIGFVIYESNLEQLSRIQEASRLGYSVYVFDNSPENVNSKKFAKNRNNIVYLTSGKNVGLGRGMASVCAQAYYDEHLALVFFDQDTVFFSETLNFIDEFYKNNLDLASKYSAISFNSKNLPIINDTDKNLINNVSLAINSGSLFFLENLKKLNWHNDRYFVDCVDYEFCLNSKMHGFEIGEFSITPGFDHSTEQADKKYKLLWKSYSMRAYPLFRIMDTSRASLKLIFKAAFGGEYRFSAKIARLLFIYAVVQVLVRILNLMHENKGRR